MNMKKTVFILGISILHLGCFSYRSYVPYDLKEVNLEIPIAIDNISINDKRSEISEEDDIKIPFISGIMNKAWKHHPKLTLEHESLIKNTINQNFKNTSLDTGNIEVIINYACKEFEQTGISEIERIYLNIEIKLKVQSLQFYSTAIDTFHYESMDASHNHFERFYQKSIQNNIIRNMIMLNKAYINSKNNKEKSFQDYPSKI